MDFIQPLVIGLLGSLHCIGMCGAIALALPLGDHSVSARVMSGLLYNLGRTVTYGFLGILFGLLGLGFVLWGMQRWVSIAVGIIMIGSVLLPVLFTRFSLAGQVSGLMAPLRHALGRLFGSRSFGAVFLIGILNGFLPCGLVYIALAGAMLASGPVEGAVYMVLFGAGTIPALLAVSLLGNAFSRRFRGLTSKIIPVVIVLIGALFILRGLNLGIPYVSPRMEQPAAAVTDTVPAVPECCRH